jgi:hypothetical protein
MTTQNVRTKIEKTFTFSSYTGGKHITKGWIDMEGKNGEASFAESLSPMMLMIEAFKYRPLGTKIKVTMEEVD